MKVVNSQYFYVCSNSEDDLGTVVGRIYINNKFKTKHLFNELCSTEFYISDAEIPFNEIKRHTRNFNSDINTRMSSQNIDTRLIKENSTQFVNLFIHQ